MKSILEWVSRFCTTDADWPAPAALELELRVTMKAAAMMTAASRIDPPTRNAHAGMPPLFFPERATPSPVPSRCARRWFVSSFFALPISSHDNDGGRESTAPILTGVAEPRYCPFCGQPLGSFFGHRITDGSRWCEHCQESFRVSIVNLDEGVDPPGDGEGAT